MTKKLFNAILAICLLFSSLYLTAHAETVRKVPAENRGTPIKKSPEASFMDGDACLAQANMACARLALAIIPSTSAYAKLLQGNIALAEKQTDKALLLLLPLQTEESLIAEAKISLHQSLASAFERLDDAQQGIQHSMQAEAILSISKVKHVQTRVAAIHDRIWATLSKLEQAELVVLRGNNTDSIFQGWIDLRLAASNQDLISSLAGWSTLYPDHPAQIFSKKLAAGSTLQPSLQPSLATEGGIALIMPLVSEINAAKAQAFRLGLEAALNRHGLPNPVKTYPSTEEPQEIDAAHALAIQEGNTYLIQLGFNAERAGSWIEQADACSILHLAPVFADEALHIVNFAFSQGIRKIAIINSEHAVSRQMTASLEAAWQDKADDEAAEDTISVITLPDNISATDSRLLELKSQLAEKGHDMIVLALPATEARLIRPHLQISTPTMTFSDANEIHDDETSYSVLNAVRFYEIPYLLLADQAPYKHDEILDASMNANALLRWFALGADSLKLLMAAQQQPDREVIVNGLTGTLTVDSNGTIKRALPLARFTHNGITAEQ